MKDDDKKPGESVQRKKVLREELRGRFKEHGAGDSGVVVELVRNFLEERPELGVVAVFAALRGEVDLSGLCEDEGRVWVFPKVVGDNLMFRKVRSFGEDMLVGAYGILEPKDGLEEVDVADVDLFLCPGLGFDLRGGRVGRGKGFYDRALARSREDAVKVGVCFHWQLVDEVEMEEHDVKMDAVIAG